MAVTGFDNLHTDCAQDALKKDVAGLMVDLSAIGKGFAIGSAALTALALFAAYTQAVNETLRLAGEGPLLIILTDPKVVIGMLIGGIVPFLAAGMTMTAVGRAAGRHGPRRPGRDQRVDPGAKREAAVLEEPGLPGREGRSPRALQRLLAEMMVRTYYESQKKSIYTVRSRLNVGEHIST